MAAWIRGRLECLHPESLEILLAELVERKRGLAAGEEGQRGCDEVPVRWHGHVKELDQLPE